MFTCRASHNVLLSQHSNVQVSIFVTCLNFAGTGSRLYVAFVMTWYLAFTTSGRTAKAVRPVISGKLQLVWSYRPCILHLVCRKTLVLCAEFGTKIKFDLSTFIQKLLVLHKNYSTIYRSDKMSHFSYLEILISGESYQSKTRYTYSKWCNSVTKKNLDLW